MNAAPTKEQIEAIRAHSLSPYEWFVLKDLTNSMIVQNRDTGEFRVLEKVRCKL